MKLLRHLTLIKVGPNERSELRREDEATYLNLRYTAAIDRQARIREANQRRNDNAGDDHTS